MKRVLQAVGLVGIVAASAAFAHKDVQNPLVMARMDAMGIIGENTKVLGTMAKGEVAFDAGLARAAAGIIADKAGQIAALFQEPATDPKSEALPVIWESYSAFSAKADALEKAALAAAQDIDTDEDLRPALAAIGETCKSCHQTYRK